MKLSIRKSTFETNSSSTHSMILASEEEFDKLNKNELLLMREFPATFEEAFESLQKSRYNREKFEEYVKAHNLPFDINTFKKVVVNRIDDEDEADDYDSGYLFDYYDFCTYERYSEIMGERFEYDSGSYTTKSGEKIRAVAWYGYDG